MCWPLPAILIGGLRLGYLATRRRLIATLLVARLTGGSRLRLGAGLGLTALRLPRLRLPTSRLAARLGLAVLRLIAIPLVASLVRGL